jgi:hypothetical protein
MPPAPSIAAISAPSHIQLDETRLRDAEIGERQRLYRDAPRADRTGRAVCSKIDRLTMTGLFAADVFCW